MTMTERALYEIAPRYQTSDVIRTIYDAWLTIWDKYIQPLEAEILSCDDVATMPLWLLEKYRTYFNLSSTLTEAEVRQELAWRILCLNEMTDIRAMLAVLGLDGELQREGNKMYVTITLADDAEYADTVALAARVAETLRDYGPAHLLYEVTAVLETQAEIGLTYATALTFNQHYYLREE